MHKRGLCRHAVSVRLCVCHVRELRENERELPRKSWAVFRRSAMPPKKSGA